MSCQVQEVEGTGSRSTELQPMPVISRTMETTGGSALRRTSPSPLSSSSSCLLQRSGDKEAGRLPGEDVAPPPLYGGTLSRFVGVHKTVWDRRSKIRARLPSSNSVGVSKGPNLRNSRPGQRTKAGGSN